MKNLLRVIYFIVCLLGASLSRISYADDQIEVLAAEGTVTVSDAAGKSSKAVQAKSVIAAENVLATGAGSRAVVKVGTEGIIVVGKNSKVEINKPKEKGQTGFFRQISGIVYYAMNTIKGNQRPVEVRTATTTIGIRGTRFLVTDTEERNEIGMRKGTINVSSNEGDFEVHKKAEVDEFEAFKQQVQMEVAKRAKEFEDYKARTQQEFIEYKREFSLSANRMASFSGKSVEDKPLSGETKKDMESFETYAEDWLSKVQD